MSVLQKLTEGIASRSLQREGAALLDKWERTGLLEGLEGDAKRQGMARLLENQAAQLLKEASSMSGGDVEGFASVAFPIVRRVFGGLVANELVSVQPMSLPSGLIFFLDFTAGTNNSGIMGATHGDGESLYGGGRVGHEITGGVELGYQSAADMSDAVGVSGDTPDEGFYNLNTGYSTTTGSNALAAANVGALVATIDLDPTVISEAESRLLRWDADVLGLGASHAALVVTASVANTVAAGDAGLLDGDKLITIEFAEPKPANLANAAHVRRLTALGSATHHPAQAGWDGSRDTLYFVFAGQTAAVPVLAPAATPLTGPATVTYPIEDNMNASPTAGTGQDAIGIVAMGSPWALEDQAAIPEIDIKVDSIAVTAVTKKLKAKWTPELGQDLNAYHNLDAEVELTQILSEQIALEIDREILGALVHGGTAARYYWSRSPGLFVHRETGAELGATAAAPDFTGTVSEWYETLVETINDVSAQIHRKTLRGGANFVVCSPEVANILEFTSGFRANVTADADRGTIGAVNAGSLSRKFDVFVDPYFPRNVVLVGRNGSSFLESGYVYAPYVPLQVTPTIFGTEDFVPRKGVMTRYAKQMVRPDMYGLVVVRGLLGEGGSTGGP